MLQLRWYFGNLGFGSPTTYKLAKQYTTPHRECFRSYNLGEGFRLFQKSILRWCFGNLILVHKTHIKWKDCQVNPVSSSLAIPVGG